MNENPKSNTVWEDRLTWFTSSSQYRALDTMMVSQRNSSGIFPRTHHIAVLLQSPRVHVKNERTTSRIHRTDHLHVDVQRNLLEIYGQQERMRFKWSTRFSICKKIRSRTMVISRSWIREKVAFIDRISVSLQTRHPLATC